MKNLVIKIVCILIINCVTTTIEAIQDAIIHGVIKEKLSSYSPKLTPIEKSNCLIQEISSIAEESRKRGFRLDRYEPASDGGFEVYPIWEGKNEGIPLTFFIYAWPNKSEALRLDPNNTWYGTSVHKHPILCALVVLEGKIVQENYRENFGRTVQFLNEQEFKEGDAVIDDLSNEFVHRLYCRNGRKCLTLHAYGLSTEKEVMECFKNTRSWCEFSPN